mmetsp:Transcript_18284/g.40611  ORF Transcript_18284/g.40611 Transcript_18284/m.40611 type:complete len:210 (-) Transcript_18284:170-799(-)
MSDLVSGKHQPSGGALPEAAAEALRASRFPSCERNGVDQGAHNVLVHSGALKQLHLQQWGQRDGPVANMQSRLLKIAASPERGLVVSNSEGAEVARGPPVRPLPRPAETPLRKVRGLGEDGGPGRGVGLREGVHPLQLCTGRGPIQRGVRPQEQRRHHRSGLVLRALRQVEGAVQGLHLLCRSLLLESCGKGPNTNGRKLAGAVSGYLK